MNANRDRLDRVTGSGLFVSSILHSAFLWLLFAPTLVPRVQRQPPLELETVITAPRAPLVLLDVTIAEPEPDNDARMVDIIGDTSAAPIARTVLETGIATGTGGSGRHQSTAGTKTNASGGVGRASFFGTQANGDRFVYVVDTSGSMNAGRGQRLRRAINELSRSIDQLSEDQWFYVLLFASHTRQMFDSQDEDPELVQATAENKNRLRRWLETLRPSGGTHPNEALRIALEMRPSAIFLLSDGRFAGSRRGRFLSVDPAVLELVGAGNRQRTPIHTVAFEELRAQDNLKEISQLTSGQFKFVRAAVRTIPHHLDARARQRSAAHWMAVANELEAQSRQDMAQLYYQKILDHFASTPAAREAGRRREHFVRRSRVGGSQD